MRHGFADFHPVKGLDAVADAFSGTVFSDILKMLNYHSAEFILHKGVGATGTSTITVEGCDDAAGNNPVAVPFAYQAYAGATDVPGDVIEVAATGFTTTAGSSQLYRISVDAAQLAVVGKGWVRIKAVEVVDSPVLGGILAFLRNPRFNDEIPATAIA